MAEQKRLEDMNLEDKFNQLVEEWKKYCSRADVQASSRSDKIRKCEAYRNILKIGQEALPLVRELYNKDSSNDFELSMIQGHGLVCLVKEIVGDKFEIPEKIRGRIKEIEIYTADWLGEYLSRYV